MPAYAIYGADRETGEDRQIVIVRPDENAAREEASQVGIVVNRVSIDPWDIGDIRRADAIESMTAAAESAERPSIDPPRLPRSPVVRLDWPPGMLVPPQLGTIRIEGLTGQIATGIFIGMTLFIAFGWVVAIMLWSAVGAGIFGIGALSQVNNSQPATAVASPTPAAVEAGPASSMGFLQELAAGGVRLRDGEFEIVTSGGVECVRWRATAINDTPSSKSVGVAAAVHSQDGVELWRGQGWRAVVPPGRHVLERTEPLGRRVTLDRYAELRLRLWNPGS